MDSSFTQRDENLKATLEASRNHIPIFDMQPCARVSIDLLA